VLTTRRLPIHYPNPREFPVNPGKRSWAPGPEKPPVCRDIRAESARHVLLAMQKVEGSNPFSGFGKGLAFAGLFRARLVRQDVDTPRLSDSAAREQDDEDLAVSACGRPDGVGGDDRLVAT
jgi:hypothetical protein